MRVIFDIANIYKDIVLDILWLQKFNSSIDWQAQTIQQRNFQDYEVIKKYPKKGKLPTVIIAWVQAIQPDKAPDLPKEFKEFEDVFREPSDSTALPKHQPWDYKIVLKDGKKPGYLPIYSLSKNKKEVLQEYIKTILAKRHI